MFGQLICVSGYRCSIFFQILSYLDLSLPKVFIEQCSGMQIRWCIYANFDAHFSKIVFNLRFIFDHLDLELLNHFVRSLLLSKSFGPSCDTYYYLNLDIYGLIKSSMRKSPFMYHYLDTRNQIKQYVDLIMSRYMAEIDLQVSFANK